VLENWHPHFTLLNPYTGGEAPAMASRLAQLFHSYRHVVVPTICLLIQEHNEANWQIYQEFRR
jgi:2'-5' RNA ligase